MPAAAPQPAPTTVAPSSAVHSSAVDDLRWKQVEKLPCHISIEVAVPGFTLKDLLALRVKSIVRSQLATNASPPVRVNGEIVASGDFEVLGKRLAVRLTELG